MSVNQDASAGRQTTLVLVRPQGPINVGLACRAAANMGVQRIRVVSPGPMALDDVQGRPFACQATPLWAAIEVFDNVADAVADQNYVLGTTRRLRRPPMPLLTPQEAQEHMAQAQKNVAIVFGSEADGLSGEELSHCDAALAFELPGTYPSLNLSHAVVLTLWTLLAHPQAAVRPANALATPDERRALTRIWGETLQLTGFFSHMNRLRFLPKLQALSQRLLLSAQDVHLMAGMLKHFQRAAGVDPSAPSALDADAQTDIDNSTGLQPPAPAADANI